VSEKISDVGFLYGDPGRYEQPHTNLKPVNLHLTLHENINISQSYRQRVGFQAATQPTSCTTTY
jgi:hypothetical protein